MTPEEYVERLLQLESEGGVPPFLEEHGTALALEAIPFLKQRAEEKMLADPGEAARIARLCQQVAAYTDDPLAYAQYFWTRGNVLLYQGFYEDCLDLYRRAMIPYTERGMDLEVARLQSNCVAALKNLGRYQEALELANEARETVERFGPTRFLAALEMNLGVLYKNTDHYDEALAACERGRSIWVAIGDEVQEARIEINRALVLEKLDEFREAVDILEQKALPILIKHGESLEIARLHLNRGLLYTRMGRYLQALRALDEARLGFDALGVGADVAVVDWHKAVVYAKLNLLPDVIELCQQAKAVFIQQGMEPYMVNANIDAAGSYRRLNEGQEALRLLNEARAILARSDVPVQIALLDLERASALLADGLAEQALSIARTANESLATRGLTLKAAQAQLIMAACHLALDQEAEAAALYEQTLPVVADIRLPEPLYRAHLGLGRIAEKRSEGEAALEHYRQAITHVERALNSLGVGEFMAGFMDDKLAGYQSAVKLSLGADDLPGAFGYVERAKSVVMLAQLANAQQTGGLPEDPTRRQLLNNLARLKEGWHWQYDKLERLETEDVGLANEEARREVWIGLTEKERQIAETARSLQLRDERYALSPETSLRLEEVQSYLDDETLLLVYYVVEGKVMAFLISRAEAQVWPDIADLEDVDWELDTLRFNLRALSPDVVEQLQNLRDMLLEPLAAHLRDRSRLLIVPHDILTYLPFHALYNGERYLLQEMQVSYMPSASLLKVYGGRRSEGLPASEPTALIMGYSHEGRLPFVLQEAEAVRSVFPTAHVFVEQAATAGNLRDYAPGCHLLHLATHGVFRDDNPLFSALRLADSLLTVNDIYSLSLPRASLVTLSACETGMGQLRGGDLIGLSQAFLHAGANSLVVSLWQVQDLATARLMENFYRNLAAGQGKSAALRDAQLGLLRQAEYNHPFYWAGWGLVGAPGPSTDHHQ